MRLALCPIIFASLLLLSVRSGSAAEPFLRVIGPEKTLTLSASDFEHLPHVDLTADDPHEKKPHRYHGVVVGELLAQAGAPVGEKLRGPALQLGVWVRAKDGYAVLFALAEFDAAFNNRTLLLVDRIDDQPLPEKSATLQLIVPGDKRAARWSRMVSSIEVVNLAPPAAKP